MSEINSQVLDQIHWKPVRKQMMFKGTVTNFSTRGIRANGNINIIELAFQRKWNRFNRSLEVKVMAKIVRLCRRSSTYAFLSIEMLPIDRQGGRAGFRSKFSLSIDRENKLLNRRKPQLEFRLEGYVDRQPACRSTQRPEMEFWTCFGSFCYY